MPDTKLNIDIRGKDNASKAINKVDNNLAKLGKTVKIAGGLLGGFFALKAARQFIELGDSVGDVTAQFNQMAYSMGTMGRTALPQLRAATQGLVSDFDLMASANKLALGQLGKTIDTTEEMSKMFEIAERFSSSMGGSIESWLDTIGTAKGFKKWVGDVKEGGNALGVMNAKLATMPKYAGGANENLTKLSVVFTNLKNSLGKGLADSPAFARITAKLTDWFDTGKIQKWIDTLLRGLEKVFNLIDRNPKAALAITAASVVALSPGGQGAGKAAGEIITKRAAAELGLYGGAGAAASLGGAKVASKLLSGSGSSAGPASFKSMWKIGGRLWPVASKHLDFLVKSGKLQEAAASEELVQRTVAANLLGNYQTYSKTRVGANVGRYLKGGIVKDLFPETKPLFSIGGKTAGFLGGMKNLSGLGQFAKTLEVFPKIFALIGKLTLPLRIIELAFGIFKGAAASFAEKGTTFGKTISSLAKSINKMFDGDTAFGKVGKVIFKILNVVFYIGKYLGDKLADRLVWLDGVMAKLSKRDLKKEAIDEKRAASQKMVDESTKMDADIELEMAKAYAASQREKQTAADEAAEAAAKAARDAAIEARLEFNKNLVDKFDTTGTQWFGTRGKLINATFAPQMKERLAEQLSKFDTTGTKSYGTRAALIQASVADMTKPVEADFTLLSDATNVLIDTLNQEVITLKYFGSALGNTISGSGQSLFGSATQSWLTTKITGTPAQIGVGLALMAGGKLLSSIFGKKKNEDKDTKNLEKIAINTGDTANYLKQVIGAPAAFANGSVSALAYAGISRQFADGYSRG